MYKICKTPKSEARQREFQDTLIKMLEKQKMKDITIVALCQEMGISRKTFYQYFDTIEDVLYATIDKELRNGFLLLEITPQVVEFFQFWKDRKNLLDLLEKNGMSELLVYRANFLSDLEKGEMYTLQKMKYAGWMSALLTVLVLWHHGGMKQSLEEMTELVYDMFYAKKGIVNKNKQK